MSGSRNGGSPSLSEGASVTSVTGASPGAGVRQGPVLQFFTKLRRHASLEGASPYFKIKKWKLDSSQRASSLDTRGRTDFLLIFTYSMFQAYCMYRMMDGASASFKWFFVLKFSVQIVF